MWGSLRRFGPGLVGVAAILMFARQAALGQPAAGVNPNVYVNPLAAAGRFANTATLGQPLSVPASAGRLGYSSLAPGAYAPAMGYGTLAASYANPSLGYGSLMNNNNRSGPAYGGMYGGYGMMGLGWGTQWMINPYQGYLSGAAGLTKANAQYQKTIQVAKLLRQEARRSALQTRRAIIEEAEWERAHMPDPEKIRQQALERELDRARHTPPRTDIWTARALNALLRHLIDQQGRGAKGREIPLSEETLKHINLTVGDSRGNIGLIKDGADHLQWPLPLQKEIFMKPRESLTEQLQRAYNSARSDSAPTSAVLNDLQDNFDKLKKALDANVDQLSFDESIEAHRYLRDVKAAITALKNPNVANYFNGNIKAKGRSVPELVQYMRENGLMFNPVSPGGESAYVALYRALASFDAGMQQPVSTSSSDGDNK